MKNAILLFHASQLGNNIHPFLINEVKHYTKCFDHVYVLCLKPKCSIEILEKYDNVELKTVGLYSLYFRLWHVITELFSKYFWKDIILAIKNNIFDFEYLKITTMQIIYGHYFERVANKIIKKDNKCKWVVESYWLTGTAYAAARIKKKHPEIISYSRLHSAEADVERNKYAICQLKGYIEHYIDFIFFVSQEAKNEYSQILNKYYSVEINEQKHIVNMLGVDNYNCKSMPSRDNTFRILSCSRVVKLKRIKMLAEVFSEWDGPPIEWIHIGDGEEFDEVESYIKKHNSNFSKCILKGDMPHDDVIKYYKSNCVDLFINISMYEGLPVSIMEALSFGIPVIATDVGGTRELINNSNGILLGKDINAKDIRLAIKNIANLTTEEYNKMRENAYRTYAVLLDSAQNFNKLMGHIGIEVDE